MKFKNKCCIFKEINLCYEPKLDKLGGLKANRSVEEEIEEKNKEISKPASRKSKHDHSKDDIKLDDSILL